MLEPKPLLFCRGNTVVNGKFHCDNRQTTFAHFSHNQIGMACFFMTLPMYQMKSKNLPVCTAAVQAIEITIVFYFFNLFTTDKMKMTMSVDKHTKVSFFHASINADKCGEQKDE